MGFIGSALCRHLVMNTPHRVINLDKMTYAASAASVANVEQDARYRFVPGDIADTGLLTDLLSAERVDVVVNLAAETHVDRSIDGPAAFIDTNVLGMFRLLESARVYWSGLAEPRRASFRFHHVSTDEVYGQLDLEGPAFTEETPYAPSSPYAASKAASDHFALAWHRTYGLPVIVSNCSNNYGPCQFPEKLIPLTILNGLEGRRLPVYGEGRNVRDWLHVDDHVRALEHVALNGRVGGKYNIGGRSERSNLSVVQAICDRLDRLRPLPGGASRRGLIEFVADRPGHDLRYAVDPSHAEDQFGWRAEETFETGIDKTVRWYLDNEAWWRPLRERYAGNRLGLDAEG